MGLIDHPAITFSASGNWVDDEFEAGPVYEIPIRVDGTATSGGGGAGASPTRDAPLLNHLSNTPLRVEKNQRAIITIDTTDLYWLYRWFYGADDLSAPMPGGASTAVDVLAETGIPIRNPRSKYGLGDPAYMIDVIDGDDLKIRGRFGNGSTDYMATNSGTSTSNVRISQKQWENVRPSGTAFLEPRIHQLRMPIESQVRSHRTGGRFTFENDEYLLGCLIRQHDDSASGDAERVDGLVSRVHAELRTPDGNGTEVDAEWKVLQRDGFDYFRVPNAERNSGMAWLNLGDEKDAEDLRFVSAGSSLQLTIDNQEVVSDGVTNVTPANPDELVISVVSWVATG